MQSTNKRKIRPGIYKFTSKTTGKSYIGQSLYLEDRLNLHHHTINREDHKNRKWHKAVLTLDWEDFVYEVLFEIIDFKNKTEQELIDILNEKEIEFIAQYNSYKKGYNSNSGGGRRARQDYSGLTLEEKVALQKKNYRKQKQIKRDNRTPQQIQEEYIQHKDYMISRRSKKREDGSWQEYRAKVRQTERYQNYMREYMRKYKSTPEWKAAYKLRKAAREAKKKELSMIQNN